MNKNKNIAFIGMSGVGKSYWSSKLTEKNYNSISCDELISQKLFPNISSSDRYEMLGKWLGYPWINNADFLEKQNTYLQTEELVMNTALEENNTKPTVFDTTGSIIYCAKEIQKKLKENAQIIFFRLDEEYINKLLNLYLENPRPILWQNRKFTSNPTSDEIKTSYKLLLEDRDKLYLELSDKVIYYSELIKIESVDEFLKLIKK